MTEAVPAVTRRGVLSAAVLLGGGALVSNSAWSSSSSAAPASRDIRLQAKVGVVSRTYTGINHASGEPAGGVPTSITVDPATGALYAGADEQYGGLCATDPSTGVVTRAPAEAGLGTISSLLLDGDTLYLGSTGGMVFTHHVPSGVEDPGSYRKLVQMDSSPSRFAFTSIAATETHLVLGTGGSYYLDERKLVTLHRDSGEITVHELPVAGHTALGIASDGTTAYVTSAEPENAESTSVVFAFEPSTGQVGWQQELFPAGYETSEPVLMRGELYVADGGTLMRLDPATGVKGAPLALRSRVYDGPRVRGRLAVLPGTNRLLYRATSQTMVVSPLSNLVNIVHDPGYYSTDEPHLIAGGADLDVWTTRSWRDVHRLTIVNAGEHTGQYAPGSTLRDPYSPPTTSPFTDVPTRHDFYRQIAWLAETGVSGGWTTPQGKVFRPTAKVTREIMAAFLYRLAGSPAYTAPSASPFADVATTRDFYRQMAWLAAAGISTGWSGPNGTRLFRPQEPVLRDQMAAFMYRLAGSPDYTPPAVSPFADVAIDHDFYRQIAWLAVAKVSTGWSGPNSTRLFRPYQPVLRDQMAAFMYRLSANAL